jgi:hypothetical protein
MFRTIRSTLVLLLLVVAASPAAAATPGPLLRAGLYAFPGSVVGAGSAASAGLGLADRWLGDEPFANPAVTPARSLSVTPQLLRVSRQDLRAEFHQFDETSVTMDVAGGSLRLPLGRFGVALYAIQPLVRMEQNAYTRGVVGAFPPPAVIAGQTDSRELRAGLALSSGLGRARLGVAGEWVRRADSYDYEEQNGVPDPGTHHAEFSGSGFGFQAGARLELGGEGAGALTTGLSLRFVPAITFDGTQRIVLESAGASDTTFTVERDAGWEGGLSARYAVSEAFRVLGSLGGRSGHTWDFFDMKSGPGFEWRVGGEFHDARDPWTLRFGLGQELQTNVPEPRSGVLGIGLGWVLDSITMDVGAIRRTLPRTNEPMSYDDRLLATVTVAF